MTRKEFYKAILDEVQGGIAVLNDRASEIASRKQKIESGKYSQDYIRKLRDEIDQFESEMKVESNDRMRKINAIIEKMKVSLDEEFALRGADINDDAKLLNFNLSAKELFDLLKRNEDNPTMYQLILKNAADRNINLGIQFVGNTREINSMYAVADAAEVTLKHYMVGNVFARLFGEGSTFERQYNIADQTKQEPVKIAYSDDRIANAVRLLKDSHTLSPVVQQDIVREFANQPGVLSILKDAAEQGRQHEAATLADNLLTGKAE